MSAAGERLTNVREPPLRALREAESYGDGGTHELLGLHEVRKSWRDHVVLDDLELVLDRGSLTAITGTNGIGKTTLLRIAAGLIDPDRGVLELDGLHPRRNRIAYQWRIGFLAAGDRGLYARLTARQHLELWGRLSLLPRGAIEPAIERVVSALEMEGLVSKRVDRLSMGQRQRLRIAMAFMHEPDVVLMDEPLNSLDQAAAELVGHLWPSLRSAVARPCGALLEPMSPRSCSIPALGSRTASYDRPVAMKPA